MYLRQCAFLLCVTIGKRDPGHGPRKKTTTGGGTENKKHPVTIQRPTPPGPKCSISVLGVDLLYHSPGDRGARWGERNVV